MRKAIVFVGIAVAAIALTVVSAFAANSASQLVGKKAPDFKLVGVAGVERSLSDFAGKYIVLEWTNFECDDAMRPYQSELVPTLQTRFKEKGVVWLTVGSASADESGYLAGKDLKLKLAKLKSKAADYLLDTRKALAAKYHVDIVPTVVLIGPDGSVLYSGAISINAQPEGKNAMSQPTDLENALTAAIDGREAPTSSTVYSGCALTEGEPTASLNGAKSTRE